MILLAYTMADIGNIFLIFIGISVVCFLAFGAATTAVVHRATRGKSKTASCLIGFALTMGACSYCMQPGPPATLKSLLLSPNKATLRIGEVKSFSVNGKDSYDHDLFLTKSAVWKSHDQTIATIVAPGVVKGIHPGTTTLSATYQGMTATTQVTIADVTLVSLEMSPQDPAIALRTPEFFTVVAHWSDGSKSDVTSTASWTSSDESVSKPSENGQCFGDKVGQAQITATYSGMKISTELKVRG